MATMRVNCKCLLCKQEMKSGDKTSFIGQVELTDEGINGFYGRASKTIPAGTLRIKHLTSSKPRGVICNECIKKIFNDYEIDEDFMNEIGYTPQ